MKPGLRSAAVYAVAAGLQRGVLFLLLPLYTRALTPSEYGELSVALSITTVLGILFAFGMDLAIFRSLFAMKDDPAGRERFIATAWRFLVVVPPALAAAGGIVTWAAIGSIGSVTGPDMVLIAMNGALFVAANTVPLAVLRADERLRDYLLVTATSAFGTGILTVIGVIVLDGGVTGWLSGVTAANALTLVVALRVLPWVPRLAPEWEQVRALLRKGIPLLPHFASQWALQLLDRTILVALVSVNAVGVYSLAANLATPVLVLVQALNQGLMPSYAKAGTGIIPRSELRKTVVLQIAGVAMVCLAGALLAPPLVDVIAPPAYAEAASIVPWLVLGFAGLGLYYIPMNGATLGANRGGWAWVATLVSAAVNVAVIVIFVPHHGIIAAAVASAVAYAVLLVAISLYAEGRNNPVQYDWRRILLLLGGAAATYAGGHTAAPGTGIAAFGLRLAFVAVYAGLAVLCLRDRVHETQTA